MKKQKYIGVINFHDAYWARIGGADLSKMTGAKGVKRLILENVAGLNGTLDVSDVEIVIIKQSDISKVSKFICSLKTKIEGLPKGWHGSLEYVSLNEVMNHKIGSLLTNTR